MNFDNRMVLVIGGAGYVGSVLTERLLTAGARVRILDNLLYDNGFAVQHLLDDERLGFIHGDLCDSDTLRTAATDVTDVVLLAALVGDPICKRYPERAKQINLEGAKRIVDCVDELGIERLVFTSTCSNYGIHDPGSLATETSELNPQSLYAETKVEVEQHLLRATRESEFTGTVLRIATAYGFSPRMRFDLTVSQFAYELAIGQPLVVYDADTWRPYCHVRDIAAAVMTVLCTRPDVVNGEVFNVGDTAQSFTKRMLVDEIRKHVVEPSVEYKGGDTDPRDYRVSFDKIATVLGYRCEQSVQRYVPRLISAARAGVFPDVRRGNRYGNYAISET